MALGLDLRASEAKLARAREHAKTLQAETAEGIEQEATHAIRFSPVDPQTGWCDLAAIPQKIDKPWLSVLLGDVIHNLRCALDYLIAPLVEASSAKLSTKHEFPIFLDRGDYEAKVRSSTVAKTKGPLRHVTHGLSVIERFQPYNIQGDPETDPLWGVYRFSNADKHRQLVPFGLVPVGKFEIAYNGIVVEKEFIEEIDDWKPDEDIPLGRIRFDPPHAYNLRAVGRATVDVRFIAPSFGKEKQLSLKLSAVPVVVECVATVVKTFRLL